MKEFKLLLMIKETGLPHPMVHSLILKDLLEMLLKIKQPRIQLIQSLTLRDLLEENSMILDIKLWPFKVESGPDDKPVIVVKFKGETKKFHPEEISSMVLTKMK